MEKPQSELTWDALLNYVQKKYISFFSLKLKCLIRLKLNLNEDAADSQRKVQAQSSEAGSAAAHSTLWEMRLILEQTEAALCFINPLPLLNNFVTLPWLE